MICQWLFFTNQSIAAFQTISTQLAYVGYKQDITWARGDKKFLFETVLTQDTFSSKTCGLCFSLYNKCHKIYLSGPFAIDCFTSS